MNLLGNQEFSKHFGFADVSSLPPPTPHHLPGKTERVKSPGRNSKKKVNGEAGIPGTVPIPRANSPPNEREPSQPTKENRRDRDSSQRVPDPNCHLAGGNENLSQKFPENPPTLKSLSSSHPQLNNLSQNQHNNTNPGLAGGGRLTTDPHNLIPNGDNLNKILSFGQEFANGLDAVGSGVGQRFTSTSMTTNLVSKNSLGLGVVFDRLN